MNYKVKNEDKVKPAGRKPIGYSLTKNNKKVCDDEIKDYIIEGINGDAQYYGYRKITHYLRRTYNLVINFKKVWIVNTFLYSYYSVILEILYSTGVI